jgi:pimeloyl-ACP methyl ester carboxylesterase
VAVDPVPLVAASALLLRQNLAPMNRRDLRKYWRASPCFWLLLLALVFTALTDIACAAEVASKYVRRNGADTVIVFVHGVMGDGVSTWTSEDGTYWPDLLTQDQTFSGADIYVVSYATGFWATLSIDEIAENFRADLKANGVAAYDKIIFISHSMGGLVTRAYLLKNKHVSTHTAFAYFFSTPTTGAEIASIARYVSSNPQFAKMKTMNADEYLADLYRQWLAAKFDFPSYCAYEKRATSGILIVTMSSAAALCTRALDPIDTDHSGIVKPNNTNSATYTAFKAAYADAKIPELRTRLDTKVSLHLQSQVAELAPFPKGPEIVPPRTVLETTMTSKLPLRLFGVLGQYDKTEILGVPHSGQALFQFKQDYYHFQSDTAQWENNLLTRIGEIVAVRFRQGWQIYLRYVILRAAGQSKAAITAQGNFLNYDITWDDAERVFGELMNDPALHQETQNVLAAAAGVREATAKIASDK